MNKYFYIGIAIYFISTLLVSIRFDIPYQLNFNSLINKINIEGFLIKPTVLVISVIIFICLIVSLIPFKNSIYINRFSIIFLILNILFFGLAIYAFVDSTIIYSKVSCEFKQPDF